MGKTLLAVVSFVVFYLGFYWLFGQNHFLASALVASVALHEAGHALLLWVLGYPSKMIFIPFLGAAVIPDDEKVVHKLPWHMESYVALIGPAVNVALIIVGLFLMISANLRTEGAIIASLNASLAAFNLIPFGILDGGRFIKAIFKSLDEEADSVVTWIVFAVATTFSALMIYRGRFAAWPCWLCWQFTESLEKMIQRTVGHIGR